MYTVMVYIISMDSNGATKKKERRNKMRKESVNVETREEAETLCPWACEIVEVEGGWMCFESATDYEMWMGQE